MSADERDVRVARMLLASLPDAPDSAVQAIAGHIAKLRDRAVDRVCEVHEQADDAHAAGYAEAVADVVVWLRATDDLPGIVEGLQDGAHVGAAKKGGDT